MHGGAMASDRLIQQLIRHEGLKLKPYRCPAGKLTIGVGRNIEDNGITREEALYLLNNDIARCQRELYGAFPWFSELSETRREVLINMCFNLGLSRLQGFKNMLSALMNHDYEQAAEEMENSAWAKQVGFRADELAEIMRRG